MVWICPELQEQKGNSLMTAADCQRRLIININGMHIQERPWAGHAARTAPPANEQSRHCHCNVQPPAAASRPADSKLPQVGPTMKSTTDRAWFGFCALGDSSFFCFAAGSFGARLAAFLRVYFLSLGKEGNEKGSWYR